MSTYASIADVANYIEGWVTDDVFALERLIQRSEQDIDRLVVPVNVELPPTQVISLPGATGGSFVLALSGLSTASIPYPPVAATVASALGALSSVGTTNVAVVGTNPFTVVWGVDWARQNFTNYNVPLLTVDATGLTPPGVVPVVTLVPGRRVNPLVDLDSNQALGLSRATCAQVEYRNSMGESFFVRPQFKSVKGPDFETEGKLPRVGPKARWELSSVGLMMTSGRAVGGYARRGIAKGWPNY